MNIEKKLKEMSIEQKAALCVGMNFWMTREYPDLGIPSLFLSDGPHGLRKQDVNASDHLGINESHQSVCYPTACTTACSWDRDLMFRMGSMLGREAAQSGVDILLGPGINIKRSPLCGRNFEYFSEDPYLAGQLAASFVRGIQSAPVSACVKHFAANSQENRRKAINAIMDERTLREIYLPAFEAVVRLGDVDAVMTSYNKINGEYPAQNKHVSSDILRDEWGFDGVLLTDWGAMDKIVPSIKAGLNLQMPGDDGSSAAKIAAAVNAGELTEDELNRVASALLRLADKLSAVAPVKPVTPQECHDFAAEVARNSMVLLKNQGGLLPLSAEDSVAVIGEMATSPRYQGAGSSHVNPYRITSALEEMRKVCPKLVYAQGYSGEESTDAQMAEAVNAAKACHAAVLFIGLPAAYESETYDRTRLSIPDAYCRLVEALAAANPNLVVVLSNGSVIEMPWIDRVPAILEAYLGGEASGTAVSDLIFGRCCPSGKLAETFPVRLEDNPTYLYTSSGEDKSNILEYREGIFVGYRYYEKKRIPPLFPFGHGLSYTEFQYSDLKLSAERITDMEGLSLSFKLRNVGNYSSKEAVQLYVSRLHSPVAAPEKELKEFAKVELAAGEEKTVTFTLDKRAFAYYNVGLNDWYVPPCSYEIRIGTSSADIRLCAQVYVEPKKKWYPKATRNTILKDILGDEKWFEIFREKYEEIRPYLPFGLPKMDINTDPFARGMLNNMTLNSLASYVGSHMSDSDIDELTEKLNKAHD